VLGVCLAYCCYCGVEYHYQAQAQFKVFADQVKARDDKLEMMTAGIKPLLDCIGFALPKGTTQLLDDPPPRTIVDWCQTTWSDFKEFIDELAQLRLHYHSVDLQWG
jgi:hypothetical protein